MGGQGKQLSFRKGSRVQAPGSSSGRYNVATTIQMLWEKAHRVLKPEKNEYVFDMQAGNFERGCGFLGVRGCACMYRY